MTTKKVTLNLIGIDGNAFSVMGVFRRQARKEGWSNEEIDSVLKEAMSSDYNHLLATIASHCSFNDDDDCNYCVKCANIKDEDNGSDYCDKCLKKYEEDNELEFEDDDDDDDDDY